MKTHRKCYRPVVYEIQVLVLFIVFLSLSEKVKQKQAAVDGQCEKADESVVSK